MPTHYYTIKNGVIELPTYITLAQDVAPIVDPLMWWKGHKQHLPNWSKALLDVWLVQPSSAAAESVLNIKSIVQSPKRPLLTRQY